MKIHMIESRPAPGGTEPCYLAGLTYTLATKDEIAMAKGFLEEGIAVADSEPETEAPKPSAAKDKHDKQ